MEITAEDDTLYLKEMAAVPRRKPIRRATLARAATETMKHAYHLEDTILDVCRSDDAKDIAVAKRKCLSRTMTFFNKNLLCDRSEPLFSKTFSERTKSRDNRDDSGVSGASRWSALVSTRSIVERHEW